MGLANLAVYKGSSSGIRLVKDSRGYRQQESPLKAQLSTLWTPWIFQTFSMAVFFAMTFLAMTCPLMAFDMGQSTRCVTIPNQMKVCKDVGYSEMRLPNFLGHSNLEGEVVPRSEDWKPLLQTGCHPQAQAFLCSLIAPVCLDT